MTRLLGTLTVVEDADASRIGHATVAVGLAVAAAHRVVSFGAAFGAS